MQMLKVMITLEALQKMQTRTQEEPDEIYGFCVVDRVGNNLVIKDIDFKK